MHKIMVILGLLLCSTANAAERTVEQNIPVDADVRFSIEAHRGSLEIVTADTDTVSIFARITHDDEDMLDRVHIDIESSARRVEVETDFDEPDFRLFDLFSGFNNVESPKVHYRITLPRAASLRVESHRTELDLAVPTGPVEISSHRGKGRVSGISNDLEIESHRTDLDLEILSLHDIALETHRGNIEMDIHDASDFEISADTHRGDVRIRGRDIPVDHHDRQLHLRYEEGTAENLITMDSHRGDIRINFIDR